MIYDIFLPKNVIYKNIYYAVIYLPKCHKKQEKAIKQTFRQSNDLWIVKVKKENFCFRQSQSLIVGAPLREQWLDLSGKKLPSKSMNIV